MNTSTSTNRFSEQEREALEVMLEAPDAVELHGDNKAWQQALAQVTSTAPARPNLRDALGFGQELDQEESPARPAS